MKNDQLCLIITGGMTNPAFLKKVYQEYRPDMVIAVDSGLNNADAAKLPITHLIGDFDSVNQEILAEYEMRASKGELRIKRLVPEKDLTDTQSAIEEAISLGATELLITGATGSRLDHVLANINLLMIPLRNGVKACILDTNNKIYLTRKTIEVVKNKMHGKYLSLLPLTNEVTGVTLIGMKYPLTNHTLVQGESLGVSNELVDEKAEIQLKEGTLIVIESHD